MCLAINTFTVWLWNIELTRGSGTTEALYALFVMTCAPSHMQARWLQSWQLERSCSTLAESESR